MDIKERIEAILFIGDESIKIKEIAKYFSISVIEIIEVIDKLKEERKHTGINVEIKDERVYLVTNPLCGETINLFFNQETKPKKLSKAALEVVSIIAYKQPVTKGDIEAIRGVAADSIVNSLEERNFVRVCGEKKSQGRPKLYEVTENFLAYLGIKTVEELPNHTAMRGEVYGESTN